MKDMIWRLSGLSGHLQTWGWIRSPRTGNADKTSKVKAPKGSDCEATSLTAIRMAGLNDHIQLKGHTRNSFTNPQPDSSFLTRAPDMEESKLLVGTRIARQQDSPKTVRLSFNS